MFNAQSTKIFFSVESLRWTTAMFTVHGRRHFISDENKVKWTEEKGSQSIPVSRRSNLQSSVLTYSGTAVLKEGTFEISRFSDP